MRVKIPIAVGAPLLAAMCLPVGAHAQGTTPAPAAPASYPPYQRPVSSYVPPRTPDGQPDVSGLYVAIPLPRGIETPLVPLAGRAPNRANAEFSYSLNERPKLPDGARARPASTGSCRPADRRRPAARSRRRGASGVR